MSTSLVQGPDAIGCKCSVCGEWQRWTPSGMVCKNGHGGADGINHKLYSAPRPIKDVRLTPEEIAEAIVSVDRDIYTATKREALIARAVEQAMLAKLGVRV